MATPSGEGLSFFVSWGLVEWVMTGTASLVGVLIGWAWRMSIRLEELSEEVRVLERDTGRLSASLEEADKQREELKILLIEKISQLPSRVFIESQIQQMTQRMDGIIDSKLRQER